MKVLQEITVPHESVNDEFVTVVSMKFSTGMPVKRNDILLELETSKALVTVEADTDGFVLYHCKEGDEVPVNGLVAQITDSPAKEQKPSNTAAPKREKASKTADVSYETIFSDKAKEAMKRYDIGPDALRHLDFVTEQDVLAHAGQAPKTIEKKNVKVAAGKMPDSGEVRFEKILPTKKREIEYLRSAQPDGLTSTIYMDIDVSAFFDSVRDQLLYFKDSMLPVTIYEAGRLLKKFPVLNGYYADQSIGLYQHVNIGVAIDIEHGLKVVKIPSADSLTIRETEEKLFDLSNRYLDQKLTTEDLTGVTFTITDLSMNGAHFFTPLINKDNSAILGISAQDHKLRRVIFSLTFDHRMTEGKTATAFLTELKKCIESYAFRTVKGKTEIACYKCMKKLEDDLNDVGFIRVVNQRGEEKYICDACLLNS